MPADQKQSSPAYLLTVWGVGYKMNGAPEKCWPYSLSSYPGSACCSFSIYTPSTENSKNGSPLAPYFPWAATYLLITGRIGNAALAAHVILAALCLASISASIHDFQKADIPTAVISLRPSPPSRQGAEAGRPTLQTPKPETPPAYSQPTAASSLHPH